MPLPSSMAPLVDEAEEEWEDAYSCLAARKLLRSELVSSRLERNDPGLRMMEGPPATMFLQEKQVAQEISLGYTVRQCLYACGVRNARVSHKKPAR